MGLSEQLVTERLILRRLTLADAPSIQEHCGNWNIASKLSRVPHPYPDGAAEIWIAAHDAARAEMTGFYFAIEQGATLIGVINLETMKIPNAMEISYWLGEPFWGNGYVTEAGHRIVRFAFEELYLAFLHSGYFVDNLASGHVLSKLGFRKTGEEMRLSLARGCRVATVLAELTRQEAGF